MADLNGFNAKTVDPMKDFEPLPAGKYPAVITASEMKSTKTGNGKFLELAFEIIEGAYKGRRLWSRLNLENPNLTAVKIACAELSMLCRAVGVLEPKDSVELHNLPLLITVKCKTRNDTGEVTNEVRGYAKKDVALPAKPVQAANFSAPWKRG
jgi:hypothetical protein